MSNVNCTLAIGGRTYVITCAAGEEAHVKQMGAMIDAKLALVPGGNGQNESRGLLFAALMLADEVHELQKSAPAAPELGGLADRLEALAAAMEKPAWAQPGAQA